MIRTDKSKFLLFIEPTLEQKSQIGLNDEYTQVLRMAMQMADLGTSNYKNVGQEPIFNKGKHYPPMLGIPAGYVCCDGTKSHNTDFLLPGGYITHGLCVHYMMWYRSAFTKNDWDNIYDLQRIFGRSESFDITRQKM